MTGNDGADDDDEEEDNNMNKKEKQKESKHCFVSTPTNFDAYVSIHVLKLWA